MEGSSQGSPYPEHRATHPAGVSPRPCANCGNTANSWACRESEIGGRRVCRKRQRVRFADATTVRERVEEHAGALRLRGAPAHALTAVLRMLCGWSKLTDNRVALRQIVDLIAEQTGGRRYNLKTIGRALATLADADLIVYSAAQGRGARAFVAIHDRFAEGIEVLERDRSGRVITDYSGHSDQGICGQSVTFSGDVPLMYQNPYPPTPRNETQPETSRPTGVKVSSAELRDVLRALPGPLAQLPRHLRWMLGGEIAKRLKAGWRPDQIFDVLAAPMPATVERPWRLALWRLRHNITGSGPRLKPLQQAWDSQADAAARRTAADATTRWYDRVVSATSPQQRAELLRADELKFGRRSPDPIAALAAAGSRVTRLFPNMPLAAALIRWSEEVLVQQRHTDTVTAHPEPELTSVFDDLLMNFGIGGSDCVVCSARPGTMRPEMPLKSASAVCDHCWPHIATELAGGADNTDEAWEAIPA